MRYGLNHIFLFQVAAASLLSPDASSAGASAALLLPVLLCWCLCAASSAGASAAASSAGASAAASSAGASAAASSAGPLRLLLQILLLLPLSALLLSCPTLLSLDCFFQFWENPAASSMRAILSVG